MWQCSLSAGSLHIIGYLPLYLLCDIASFTQLPGILNDSIAHYTLSITETHVMLIRHKYSLKKRSIHRLYDINPVLHFPYIVTLWENCQLHILCDIISNHTINIIILWDNSPLHIFFNSFSQSFSFTLRANCQLHMLYIINSHHRVVTHTYVFYEIIVHTPTNQQTPRQWSVTR